MCLQLVSCLLNDRSSHMMPTGEVDADDDDNSDGGPVPHSRGHGHPGHVHSEGCCQPKGAAGKAKAGDKKPSATAEGGEDAEDLGSESERSEEEDDVEAAEQGEGDDKVCC